MALSSSANFPFKKTKRDPDVFVAKSKSIRPNIFPISSCDKTLKLNFGILPTFFNSLFDLSSFPIGTSSKGIFGISLKISSIFF